MLQVINYMVMSSRCRTTPKHRRSTSCGSGQGRHSAGLARIALFRARESSGGPG